MKCVYSEHRAVFTFSASLGDSWTFPLMTLFSGAGPWETLSAKHTGLNTREMKSICKYTARWYIFFGFKPRNKPVCRLWPRSSSACRWHCGWGQRWSPAHRCSCWGSDRYLPPPTTSQWSWLWSLGLFVPWSEMPPGYSSVRRKQN